MRLTVTLTGVRPVKIESASSEIGASEPAKINRVMVDS